MAAPPPTDSLVAALLVAVLGVFAPATGFLVTVLKPAATTACSPAAWEERAQQLVEQLGDAGSADAQSLRQQLTAAGVTPSARRLVAPTTTATAGSTDWRELAARLSAELAHSEDPEARALAQAIGDTGTPDTSGPPTTRARTTPAPGTSAPGAARPMPGGGDSGTPDTGSGGTGTGDAGGGDPGTGGAGAGGPTRTPAPTASRSASDTVATRPSDTAAPRPSAGPARPGSGPCPALPDRGIPAPDGPSTADSPTQDPSTQDPSSPSGARATTGPTPARSSSSPGPDQRWEGLAAQLAAALADSTDPRAAGLRAALQRAGFTPARPGPAAPRTTATRSTATPTTATSTRAPDPGGGG